MSHSTQMTVAAFDLAAMTRALEHSDADTIVSLYEDDAEMEIVDRDRPPSTPMRLVGRPAIEAFWRDVCSRQMTHAVGETISGWVQEVDGKRKRVSLSLREIAKGDPWKGIEERFAEGAVVQGTVESAAQFGVFINLEPGLTGLLPTAEMGVPKGTNPARLYSPGQKVTVQVTGIDKRRKRISLAREGSRIEGSRADYQAYRKRQQETGGKGMGALAHALAKLRDERVE